MHSTFSFSDHRCVALDHAWYLLALVRVNQEYNLVMTHYLAPYGLDSLPHPRDKARSLRKNHRYEDVGDYTPAARLTQPLIRRASGTTPQRWPPRHSGFPHNRA